MITDPHDPREFRRYLSFNEDGTVAAVHDFAAGVEQPALVEVTALVPAPLDDVTVDPALLSDLKAATAAVDEAANALAQAKGQHVDAKMKLTDAVTISVNAQKVTPEL